MLNFHSYERHIPELTIQGILRYVTKRIPPGDFLMAVLTNNLKESFGRADARNRAALFEIVSLCHNEIPAECWGSRENVSKWLEVKDEE